MFASLQARLLILLLLLVVAAVATGVLMVGMFKQSAVARVGQAGAELERACDAISAAYRFYSAGLQNVGPSARENFVAGLGTVVQTALRRQAGIEGGIWLRDRGSLAYAYPTYEGSGPKTDLPQAELPRIAAINRVAAAEDRMSGTQYASTSQTLLLTACPLSGPLPDLTAWTMTRVSTFAGRAYGQLMTGLAVLMLTVLAAAAVLIRLTLSWRRHIAIIRANLSVHEGSELLVLAMTGERELDQIVAALNSALARLAQVRARAQVLAGQVATAERLAAIGRVTAGVAHEIRNPIATMRLKVETALAKGPARHSAALHGTLEQIARLDRLLRRLLNVTEPERANLQRVEVAELLYACVDEHRELARLQHLELRCESAVESAELDPQLMRRALENLILNAIQASPPGSVIELRAQRGAGMLILSVTDCGGGPPAAIRERLFEPFVTGRPEGTGLGLSIVREVAEAHRGSVDFRSSESGTTFAMTLPCQPS